MRMGRGRQPLSDEHEAALEKLRSTLRGLLAEQGLLDGQSPAAPLAPQQIDAIVQGVLAALQQRGVV
jgi:hypothetical protein